MGMSARNYVVRYTAQGKEIEAVSIESVSMLSQTPQKYVGRAVEVFVDPKTPRIVSIRGDHSMDITCGMLLLLGIFGILVS